tara:strand:+ start:169 stop:687 length:519 start_codon:yes stop_codon:yes gene_type:complete
MKFFNLIPLSLILLCGTLSIDPAQSGSKDSKDYKILSSKNEILSVNNVRKFIDQGDEYVNSGKFEKAKDSYDKGRDLAKQLSSFYRDLNGSFRGLDARIPAEMDKKGRQSIKIWADSNARLAALYKRKNQHEVAVPLLVEIIRLMSPTSPEGKSAYNELVELGFVETKFKGF